MKWRVLGAMCGALMLTLGAYWTAHGLGWLGAGSRGDAGTLATVGPIVAGLGVALAFVSVQRR